MGRPADEGVLLPLGTVDHTRQCQPLRHAELLTELEETRCGRASGEHVVRNRPKRKDIDLLAYGIGREMHLWSLVDCRAAIGERLDVGGDEMRRGGQRRAGVITAADLPVENLDPRVAIWVVEHENALGRKSSMDDPFLVGMADRLGDLPDDREPSID